MKSPFLRKLLNFLKLTTPWAVTALLFWYLFKKIPPDQVLQSLRFANLPVFIVIAVVYFLTIMTLDTWSLSKVLSQFAAPITFRELLPTRCISYLLSLVNYNAGQAGMAIHLKQSKGLSFFKTLGAIFFLTATDLYWVVILAFIGSFFIEPSLGSFPIRLWIQRVAYICLGALILHLSFWRGWFAKIVPKKLHFGFGDWLRGKHLFQPFHHATLKDYVRIALYRLPIHLTIVSSMWVTAKIFGGDIAFRDIFATVPVILLMGAIPITPGGLGAVQIATVELLKNKVTLAPAMVGVVTPEQLLFAMSLALMFSNYFLKALAGFFFMLKNSQKLFLKAPSADLLE